MPSQQVLAGNKTVQGWLYLKINVLNFKFYPQGNLFGQKEGRQTHSQGELILNKCFINIENRKRLLIGTVSVNYF